MDAKRLIPELTVRQGRVLDPATGADLGSAVDRARQLELGGADEVLIRSLDLPDPAWLEELARRVYLPLALAAPFTDPAQVADALARGADRVVLPLADLAVLGGPGRGRIIASACAAEGLEALGRARGASAGEVLLDGAESLGADAARDLLTGSPLPVAARAATPEEAAAVLSRGADAVVFPAGLMPATALKAALAPLGLDLRP